MANDVYELFIGGNVAGEYVANVLAFQSSVANSSTPEADADNLILAWQVSAQAAFLACLPTDYIQHGIRARRVNNSGGNSATSLTPATAGGGAGTSITAGNGPVITASYYNSGGSPARWRATRIFMPSYPYGDIIENEIQPALSGDLATLIGLISTNISSGGLDFLYCAWSRSQKVSYALSNFNVSNLIGTQRKRLRPAL